MNPKVTKEEHEFDKKNIAQIIIDTNFLLLPVQFKVDIFEEFQRICDFPYELVIIDLTIVELDNIAKTGNMKDRMAAKVALGLLEKKNIKKLITKKVKGKIVDDYICDFSKKNSLVATNDKGLRMRLMRKGVHIVGMRQKVLHII